MFVNSSVSSFKCKQTCTAAIIKLREGGRHAEWVSTLQCELCELNLSEASVHEVVVTSDLYFCVCENDFLIFRILGQEMNIFHFENFECLIHFNPPQITAWVIHVSDFYTSFVVFSLITKRRYFI